MATIKSIEEKAKAYDEALKVLHKYDGANIMFSQSLKEEMFPELKEESEDERIRKEIISFLKNQPGQTIPTSQYDSWLCWLEKQGNTDLEFFENGENEKREFVGYGFLKCKGDFLSFKEGETYWLEYVGKDNYNVRSDNLLGQTFHITPQQLYIVFRPTTWLEKQAEQKSTDKIEPKFKIGDKVHLINGSSPNYEDDCIVIGDISNDTYYGNWEGGYFAIKDQDKYELVEQKPSWSEEDYNFIKELCDLLASISKDGYVGKYYTVDLVEKLKSLKPQNRWKPSDEQMKVLLSEVEGWKKGCYKQIVLESLYNDLLKLKS